MLEPSEIQNKIETTLMVIERGHTATPYISVVCGAYVLSIAAEHSGVTELDELLKVGRVSDNLSRFIKDRLYDHWAKYLPLLTAFPLEMLRDYLSRAVDGERFELAKIAGSSLPVADLVCDILNIADGESVADIGCGVGDFLRKAVLRGNAPQRRVVGYEKESELAALAEINIMGNGADVKILWDDYFSRKFEGELFDKVFSQPPFGQRGLPEKENVRDFIRRAFPDFPEIPASAACDWLYVARAVAVMHKAGRAVVILPPSAMHSQQAEPFRRYFVQRNLIEAVVELPPRLFTNTAISTCMVVFSEGNESVKMIRADNLFEKGRSTNTLTKEGAAQVVEAIRNANAQEEICAVVAKADLLAESCNLTVLRHFADPIALSEGTPFRSLIKSAKRGAAITSKELDDLVCETDMGIQYISSGNINDGVVDAELMNISGVPKRYAGYCAANGDVIVTRVMANGSVFKVAVVELPEGRTLLPNGNILVVTVDPEKADPYFIKSCLENEYAQRYLRNSAVGNMVKTLHYKSLELLPIPVLPLERQKEIGDKCRAAVQRVVELRSQLGRAKDKLGSILADNAADCFTNSEDLKGN